MDIAGAVTAEEISDELGLHTIENQQWHIT